MLTLAPCRSLQGSSFSLTFPPPSLLPPKVQTVKECVAIQVHTLLKGLEKIAASADIPMLVAGDFNSVPGSAAHSLLVNRIVENNHPVCSKHTCS